MGRVNAMRQESSPLPQKMPLFLTRIRGIVVQSQQGTVSLPNQLTLRQDQIRIATVAVGRTHRRLLLLPAHQRTIKNQTLHQLDLHRQRQKSAAEEGQVPH